MQPPNSPSPIRRVPSEAQLRADRLNAQKSTGSCTEGGKQRASVNATRLMRRKSERMLDGYLARRPLFSQMGNNRLSFAIKEQHDSDQCEANGPDTSCDFTSGPGKAKVQPAGPARCYRQESKRDMA